jgi:hypothetical protein
LCPSEGRNRRPRSGRDGDADRAGRHRHDGPTNHDVTSLPEVSPCSALVCCWPCSSPWPFCRWWAVATVAAVAAPPHTRPGRLTRPRAARTRRPPPRSLWVSSLWDPVPRAGLVPARSLSFASRRGVACRQTSPILPRRRSHVRFRFDLPKVDERWYLSAACPSSKGNLMVPRTILKRLAGCWSAACVWFVRRSLLSPERSLRLLNLLSFLTGLPRLCPVRLR